MRALRALLFCLALAAPLFSQELDVWDINDFVDPRALGAEIQDGKLTCPCDGYLIFRFMGGAVSNYVDVVRLTDKNLAFGHLSASYYRGRWQANWKRTQFEETSVGLGDNDSPVFLTPRDKNTLQIGFYHGNGKRALNRTELTWTAIRNERARIPPPGVPAGSGNGYEHEVGIEHDFSLRIGRLPLDGSLIYVGRFGRSIQTALDNQRVTYLHRFPRIPLGRWSLDLGAAAGILYSDDHWRRMSFYPSAHFMSPTLPWANARLHLKYAPALQQHLTRNEEARTTTTSWRNAQQVALFFDIVPYRKRFPARTR